jgi:hypothetical protein
LRPGGKIAIWVYTSYGRERYLASDLWRHVTTRLPKGALYGLAHAAVPLYYLYKVPLIGHVAARLIPMSQHSKAEWRVLDTFDWYSPRYQWKHSYEEVFQWFEAHGLANVRILGTPVSLQGTRPG